MFSSSPTSVREVPVLSLIIVVLQRTSLEKEKRRKIRKEVLVLLTDTRSDDIQVSTSHYLSMMISLDKISSRVKADKTMSNQK